ncbi:MAG: hypothetical protein JW870_17245 [Candidatus Delongbacteria bacterium]|nr:hypothetical protein [Candidatus Delongbacteria bacterium]
MKVIKEENYIIDKKGKKTTAILPIEKYEELIEDLYDLSVIAERRDEPTISFDKLKEKIKKNGIL